MTKPFLVHCSLGGEFFMLHWWTYNERGNLILARSEESLNSVAMSVFNRHTDARIDAYQLIEIVAPPTLFGQLSEEYDRKEDVEVFLNLMCYKINVAHERGESLPLPFEKCNDYDESGEGEEGEGDTQHYNCGKCKYKIKLTITPEELFDRYSERWYALYPERQWRKETRTLSKGRPAELSEKLQCALADFGHHSSGIFLQEVDVTTHENNYRPPHLTDRVIFFYRVQNNLDSSYLQRQLDTLKENARVIRDKREENRKKDFDTRKKNEVEEIIKFFAEEK